MAQSNDKLSINKTILDDQKHEINSNVVLPFDGSKVEITASNGSKAAESCQKNTQQNIHILITLPQPDGEDHIIEDWSLTDNGKTMIINRIMIQSNGLKYNIKAYYNKE